MSDMFFLDTGVFVAAARRTNGFKNLQKEYLSGNALLTSIVNIDEITSFARRNQWGTEKMLLIDQLQDEATVFDVEESLIPFYAEIDTYTSAPTAISQRPASHTARKMTKNDLWIAASIVALQTELEQTITLITTDKDFNLLHETNRLRRIYFEPNTGDITDT
jgi:predicted nucleic acid-binding protein